MDNSKTTGQIIFESVQAYFGTASTVQWDTLHDSWKEAYDQAGRAVTLVPGMYRCPKCEFILTIHGEEHTIADRACANDGGLLVPVTWKDLVAINEEVAKGYLAALNIANQTMDEARENFYGICQCALSLVKGIRAIGVPLDVDQDIAKIESVIESSRPKPPIGVSPTL